MLNLGRFWRKVWNCFEYILFGMILIMSIFLVSFGVGDFVSVVDIKGIVFMEFSCLGKFLFFDFFVV